MRDSALSKRATSVVLTKNVQIEVVLQLPHEHKLSCVYTIEGFKHTFLLINLNIAASIRHKMAHKIPPVSENDIQECFANRTHSFLLDTREDHKTDPVTQWFISENDYGRRLKVCFMDERTHITIKSAFVPNADEDRIYAKFAKPL